MLLVLSHLVSAGPVVGPGSKKLPIEGEVFRLNQHEAFLIRPPDHEGETIPWVWYAPTLRGLPSKHEVWMFERILAAGVAIAGIDVGESYGSPEGRASYQKFYRYLVDEQKLSERPCLLARSRGGLMLYSWAVEHPEKVSGVAGIYPVCNIASYPGIARAAPAYGMSAEDFEKVLAKHNPIDRLAPLAKAKVPIRHIHGDRDKVVPLEKNSGLLAERYRALGGPVKIEIVKDGGHDLWEGWFQSEKLVEFIIAQAKLATKDPLPGNGS